MDGTRDATTLAHGRPGLGRPAIVPDFARHTVLESKATAPTARQMADALRTLSLAAVEAAGYGDAGLSNAMADTAAALWSRTLRFDVADPSWPDRDRFVLSDGRGAMLLYALLHVTGHAGMETDALRRFGQIDSPAAGHPGHGDHPAIEMTGGPPGQGLASAVGLALAERMMAARFGRSLVDHRTWVLASDSDLMDGISHEAACLAGQWRLGKLAILWSDTAGQDGEAAAMPDDVLKRFAASGWTTKRVDGHDAAQVATALGLAVRSRKPTLIACRTNEAAAPALPHDPFGVPGPVAAAWQRAGSRGMAARRTWLKRLANHPLRAEFERVTAGRLPDLWHETVSALRAEPAEAKPTAVTNGDALQRLAAAMPELLGGSALHPVRAAGLAAAPGEPGNYTTRHIHFGSRAHVMAACFNGVALHGGMVPYAVAPLIATDSMRPALRLAALMRQRVVHVLTDDSIGAGANGAAHQPMEHLAALRAIPGLMLLRPADAVETSECLELAVRRSDGPSLLVLSRQAVPVLRNDAAENRCARGGYVLAEADGPREATLIASGSEVALALEARDMLAEAGLRAAVVSLPCWELFALQDESARARVLGAALRVGIEAASRFGWERWLGPDGIFIGMTGFGASAPAGVLYRHFGITPDAVVTAVKRRLQPVQL